MKKKFKRMKKRFDKVSKSQKLLFLIACASSILFVIGTTFAWFSSTDAKENDFHADFRYKVNLVDEFTPPEKIEPNKPVSKKVTVKNTGDIDAFARVMVFPVITSTKDVTMALPISNSKEFKLTYGNLNETDWKDGKDGYYYYLKKIKPGEEAPLLFDSVTLSLGWVSAHYDDADFTIEVKSESVDTRRNGYRDSFWRVDKENPQLEEPLKSIDQILQAEIGK